MEIFLRDQPEKILPFVKEFYVHFSVITDEETSFPIDMLIDSKNVYLQNKFDVGKTLRKFHIELKPNVEFEKQRPGEVPLSLREKPKNF